MKKKIFLLACFPLLFGHCSPNPPSPATSITADSSQAQNIKTNDPGVLLLVSSSLGIVRQGADISAAEIARFKTGDTLQFANELSPHSLAIKLDGIEYDENWLKVQIGAQQGWIYGGSVRFINLQDELLQELTIGKRIEKILGQGWNNKLKFYNQELREMQTATAFEMMWQRGEEIKQQLEQKINQLHQEHPQADFGWINESFGGYQLYKIEEKGGFWLFRDLKFWQQQTLQTADSSDEAFLRAYLLLYPSDSSEFWHTELQIRQSAQDSLTASLLGRGMHEQILVQTAQGQTDPLFKAHYQQIRKLVINDICLSNRYWLPTEQAQAELQNLLNNPACGLQRSEKIPLQARLAQLANPSANGIIGNFLENGG